MTQATDTRLIEQLRETIGKCVLDDGTLVPVTFVNRDGPEAASRIESLRAEVARLREAAADALSGWRYIREHHGDLYGVGWDRVEQSLSTALGDHQ